MVNMERVKMACCGFGFMGKTHAMNLKAHRKVELVSIFSAAKDKEEIEKLNVSFYDDWKLMLESEELDAVVVATPTITHAGVAMHCISQDLHVFLEKPMEINAGKCNQIIRAANQRDVKLGLGHVLRFDNQYLSIKNAVDAGQIGVPKMIRCRRRGPAPNWSSWFFDEAKSGTVILDLSIHDLDYICWLAGREPTSVCAMASELELGGNQIFGISHVVLDFQKDNIDGGKTIELGFAEASWAGVKGFPFSTDVEVAGDDGLITSHIPGKHPLNIYGDDGGVAMNLLTKDGYFQELDDFVSAILENRPPKVSGADGLRAVRVCTAALKSAQTGKVITMGGFK